MVYVKEWLTAKGLNQEQARKLVGWSSAGISLLIAGKRQWTEAKLVSLANALDIRPEDLFRHPDATSIDAIISDLPESIKQEVARYAHYQRKNHLSQTENNC